MRLYNGGVSANFVTMSDRGEEAFHTVRRFDLDDEEGILIFLRDNDLDTSDEEDKWTVDIKTSEGKSTLTAIETGPHTGIFRAKLFPVAANSAPLADR